MRYERWVVDAPSFGPLDRGCNRNPARTKRQCRRRKESRDGKPSRGCLFGVFRLLCQFFGEGFLTLLTPEVIPDEAAKTPEEVAVA